MITKAPEDIFGSSLSELSDSPVPSPPPNVQSTNPEVDEPVPDGAAAIHEDLVATTVASVVPLPTVDSTHQNLEDVSKLLDLTTEMVSSLPEDPIKGRSEDDDARSYMSDRSSVKAEAPDSLPSDVVFILRTLPTVQNYNAASIRSLLPMNIGEAGMIPISSCRQHLGYVRLVQPMVCI